jgi:hypothetical protein
MFEMKKIFIYLCLLLLFSGNAFPADISYNSLNENLKQGYKITKETSSQKQKTFTLKKGDEILLCVVFLNDHETECWKP